MVRSRLRETRWMTPWLLSLPEALTRRTLVESLGQTGTTSITTRTDERRLASLSPRASQGTQHVPFWDAPSLGLERECLSRGAHTEDASMTASDWLVTGRRCIGILGGGEGRLHLYSRLKMVPEVQPRAAVTALGSTMTSSARAASLGGSEIIERTNHELATTIMA